MFLSIATKQYSIDKNLLINELKNYASIHYETSTRQNTLEKLLALDLKDDTVLKNIVNATTHHQWQFSKFGRDSIRTLLKNQQMRVSFERILPDLNGKEQFQLNRLLKE